MSVFAGAPPVKKQRTVGSVCGDVEDENTLLDETSWCSTALLCRDVETEPHSKEESNKEESNKEESNKEESNKEESNETAELAAVATQAHEAASEFDPFHFMASVPDRSHFHEQIREIEKMGLHLDQRDASDTRPTLVLDLDETLVHSSVMPLSGADFVFPVEMEEGEGGKFTVYAKKRPFCDQFLAAASKKFEIVVYTASKRVYADRLLDLMGFRGGRLFREHCVCYQGAFLKDLGMLGRNLARTVIVDNSPHVFSLQVRNGIPIDSYFGAPHQQNDRELMGLLSLLDHLATLDDMRSFLHRQFDLEAHIARRATGTKA